MKNIILSVLFAAFISDVSAFNESALKKESVDITNRIADGILQGRGLPSGNGQQPLRDAVIALRGEGKANPTAEQILLRLNNLPETQENVQFIGDQRLNAAAGGVSQQAIDNLVVAETNRATDEVLQQRNLPSGNDQQPLRDAVIALREQGNANPTAEQILLRLNNLDETPRNVQFIGNPGLNARNGGVSQQAIDNLVAAETNRAVDEVLQQRGLPSGDNAQPLRDAVLALRGEGNQNPSAKQILLRRNDLPETPRNLELIDDQRLNAAAGGVSQQAISDLSALILFDWADGVLQARNLPSGNNAQALRVAVLTLRQGGNANPTAEQILLRLNNLDETPRNVQFIADQRLNAAAGGVSQQALDAFAAEQEEAVAVTNAQNVLRAAGLPNDNDYVAAVRALGITQENWAAADKDGKNIIAGSIIAERRELDLTDNQKKIAGLFKNREAEITKQMLEQIETVPPQQKLGEKPRINN